MILISVGQGLSVRKWSINFCILRFADLIELYFSVFLSFC